MVKAKAGVPASIDRAEIAVPAEPMLQNPEKA
jgi:hypothetical protein